MGRGRSRDEINIRYENYLSQDYYWPSQSTGDSVTIATMPARYAASALRVLLEWAGSHDGRMALNMSDMVEREDYVRNTPLGKALAAVATSKDPVDEALREQKKASGDEVRDVTMLTEFAKVISAEVDLPLTDVIHLATRLTEMAQDRWTVTDK